MAFELIQHASHTHTHNKANRDDLFCWPRSSSSRAWQPNANYVANILVNEHLMDGCGWDCTNQCEDEYETIGPLFLLFHSFAGDGTRRQRKELRERIIWRVAVNRLNPSACGCCNDVSITITSRILIKELRPTEKNKNYIIALVIHRKRDTNSAITQNETIHITFVFGLAADNLALITRHRPGQLADTFLPG